jgi:hypothetical protein
VHYTLGARYLSKNTVYGIKHDRHTQITSSPSIYYGMFSSEFQSAITVLVTLLWEVTPASSIEIHVQKVGRKLLPLSSE